jgi:hypothetical protein
MAAFSIRPALSIPVVPYCSGAGNKVSAVKLVQIVIKHETFRKLSLGHVDFRSEVGPNISLLIQDDRHFQNGRHINLTYIIAHSLHFFVQS